MQKRKNPRYKVRVSPALGRVTVRSTVLSAVLRTDS